MPALDYGVILIFSLMILVAGLAFSKSGGKDMNSFFAAGGAVPWWLSGLSLFMSFFSAGTFVVWGSIAYEYGWVAIALQWTMSLGGFVIGFYVAPRWKSMGVMTVGEYIGRRFGPQMQDFYSYIFLALSFIMTGAFLYPVAKIFNVSTGFSIEASIIVLGLLIIIYTAAGGLWAVIITDVLQFVILFAAVLMVVPLAFQEVGGISRFIQLSPDGFFQLMSGEYTIWFLIGFVLYNTVFIGGNWAYVQRYTSVKDPQAARKTGFLFGILYLISPVLWMLPPMIYRTMNGNLAGLENEGAYLLICKQVLPVGMLGLMLGGMIFATASSVNTTLNMSAAVFTNDIYRKFSGQASNRQLLKIARISTVIFGLITIGVALLVPAAGGIVEVVISFGAITGVPLYGPPIWALFSKRQTVFSIAFTTIISLAINLLFKFLTPVLFNYSLDRAGEMLVGTLVPIGILTVFEVLLPRREKDVQAMKPKGTESLTTTGTEVSDSQNQFAMKVMAICLLFIGILIEILGVLSGKTEWSVLLIGLIIIIIGGSLLRHSR